MRDILWDLRYGLRILGKNPGFTTTSVLILGLAIGSITTIFCLLNALLFSPLPYKESDRLVYVLSGRERAGNWGACSAADFEDWKGQNQVFENMALLRPDSVNMAAGGEPERVGAVRVSGEMVSLLGITAVSGRTLPAESGNERMAMLSSGLWKRRFGSDPDVTGRTIKVDGIPHAVVGILPPEFKMMLVSGLEPDLLLPLSANLPGGRSDRSFGALARLKPGITLERARADMSAIARRLQQQYPESNESWTVWVDTLRGTVDPIAYVLIAVLLSSVLGIACANVTNLLLARAAGRQREISIRAALGAGRGRILRQLLTESILLSFLGCCLGSLISVWACKIISTLAAGTNAAVLDLRIDHRVLGESLLVFLMTCMAVGIVPALRASNADLNQPLKESGGALQSAPCRRGLRNALVASEIAISLVLLTGSALVIKSWLSLWHVDLGFRAQELLTVAVSLSDAEYPGEHQKIDFFRQLLSRLEQRADINSVAAATALPTKGALTEFEISGRRQASPGEDPVARVSSATPAYFATLGMPLLAGRDFRDTDGPNSLQVAIINENMARKHWGGQNPIGSQIRLRGRTRTIVGIAGNVRSVPLSLKPFPDIYVPAFQAVAGQMSIMLRTAADPLSVAALVRNEIQAMNPDQPASGVRRMEDVFAANMGVINLGTSLLSIVAAGAVILAVVGLYGVLSYSVSQRTGEIGIRMALGAGRRDVLKMVLRDGSKLVAFGMAPGMAASLALGRLLSSSVHGLSAAEPGLMASVAVLLLAVSLCACCIPARRATRIDPIRAIRAE
jgi:putative ABC transport system permease protein